MVYKDSIELVRKELVRKELILANSNGYTSTSPKYIYSFQGAYSDFDSLPTNKELPDIASGSSCLFYTSQFAVYSEKDDSWKLIQ